MARSATVACTEMQSHSRGGLAILGLGLVLQTVRSDILATAGLLVHMDMQLPVLGYQQASKQMPCTKIPKLMMYENKL